MKTGLALSRYLDRHIEPDLPEPPEVVEPWVNVLVIPAYNESPGVLDTLATSITCRDHCLVILVLNRPDSDDNTNKNVVLREAIGRLPETAPSLYKLSDCIDIYLHDLELLRGPTPTEQGVGLARKTGCDIALLWRQRGLITNEWICSGDADARFPQDYFQRLGQIPAGSAAAIYPFTHIPSCDEPINRATALYELWLHHYVLGLEYAGSPYAYHTLGSCLAIRGENYAQVRGFPKRAGGEDFYLLNKVAKTGAIVRLQDGCIELESRGSNRVPFGTGPAVNRMLENSALDKQILFYHPQCFEALRTVLLAVPEFRSVSPQHLHKLLAGLSLSESLAVASRDALLKMGLEAAVAHCRRQGKSPEQFTRQFHQWFDGFRSLKFIHLLQEGGWPRQRLPDLTEMDPVLWPAEKGGHRDVEQLRLSIRKHWGWTTDHQSSL